MPFSIERDEHSALIPRSNPPFNFLRFEKFPASAGVPMKNSQLLARSCSRLISRLLRASRTRKKLRTQRAEQGLLDYIRFRDWRRRRKHVTREQLLGPRCFLTKRKKGKFAELVKKKRERERERGICILPLRVTIRK